MRRLKIILKYKYLLFLIVISYSLLYISLYKQESKYSDKTNIIYGKVIEIKKTNDKVSLIIKAKEKVLVNYYRDIDVEYNDYIKVNGIFYKPENNRNFNVFNYKKYLKSKRIVYIVKANKIRIIERNNNYFYMIKNNIYRRINKYKMKDYLNTFILGNKGDMEYNMQNIYKDLGIIHLLSISGSYISIIILFLKKIKFKEIHLSIFLIIYIFLTSMQISIIRSSLSYIFMNINKRLNLNIENKDILLLIASLILLVNPFYLINIGFQLSFLISYSLMKFNYLLEDKCIIKKLLMISTISFFISLPVIINSNYKINFLSILFNIFYVPFSCFILFPLSFLVLIFPFLEEIYNFFINAFENISLYFNRINVLTFHFSKIPFVFNIFYYYFIFNKNNKFILLIIFFYFYNYYAFIPRIVFLDVNQGDSILIRYKNKNILIDTGGNYNDYSDTYISSIYSLGVKKVDYLFLTHGDKDHCMYAKKYIREFNINNVYINSYDMSYYEKEACKNKCIKLKEEDDIKINDITFNILNPNYDLYNENDNSLVIYTEIKNKKILFMGDASSTIEDIVMSNYIIGKVDILKVGHHGSNTSSSKEFIDEIKPKYSIISVGKNNRYGHPNKEVLNNLDNSKIYRTDLDGSIMFKIKNNKLKIETCSP